MAIPVFMEVSICANILPDRISRRGKITPIPQLIRVDRTGTGRYKGQRTTRGDCADPVVAEVNATVSPELAVADKVDVVPKLWPPGLLNSIVWLAGPDDELRYVTVAAAHVSEVFIDQSAA